MSHYLSSDQIMERIQAFSKEACVRMRLMFPSGSRKWYVDLGPVVHGNLELRGWSMVCPSATSGATPDEAIANTWNYILEESRRPKRFFLFYNCRRDEPIPGDAPQVWARWNEVEDGWENVPLTPEALAVRGITEDRIRSLSDHVWRQRL